MQAMQIMSKVASALKWVPSILGACVLSIVLLKVLGVGIPLVRISGSITELAVVAAACIYAGR